MLKLSLYFSTYWILFSFCQSQTVFSTNWNIRHGLPTNTIYKMAKDSSGFLYLGTELGLYQFNGIQFQPIPFKNHRSFAVSSIVFDKSNRIWCRNFSNQIFFTENDTMYYFESFEKHLFKEGNILDILPFQEGILILTFQQVFYVTTRTIHQIAQIAELESFMVLNDSSVFLTDANGFVYQLQSQKLNKLYQLPYGKYHLTNYQNKVLAVPKNHKENFIWILGKTPKKYCDLPSSINSYVNNVSSQKDFLFINTNTGLNFFDGKNWQIVLKEARISDVIQDFQGNTWISSLDNGLYRIADWRVRFVSEWNTQNQFTCIAQSPRGIFVGTKDGYIYELEYSSRKIREWDTKVRNEIEFIKLDSVNGNLYCSQGVFFKSNPHQFLQTYYGKSLHFDQFGNLYFSIHNLAGFQKIQENPYFFTDDLKKVTSSIEYFIFHNDRSRCNYFDTVKNELWIGYATNLILRKSNGKEYIIKDFDNNSLYCTSITKDSKGRIWVSTIQNGILCFQDTIPIFHFTQKNGLSGEFTKKLISSGEFIFSISEKGVDKIHIENVQIHHLSRSLGIEQLSWLDGIYSQKGLYLVTSSGLLYLPDLYYSNEILPKIWFNNLPNKTVQYNKNDIQFNWNVLSFRKGSSLMAFYRLLPDTTFHKINIELGEVWFNSLNYGEYEFEFIVPEANYSFSYSFTIYEPFWLSKWFIFLSIIFIAFVVYFIVKFEQNRQRKKQLLKEKLIFSQLTALKAQMNPHFIYNILNSIQGLIYGGKKEEASEYIGLFSDMMRKVLEVSSKQYILLHHEIEMLKTYLEVEKLRMKDLEYLIELENNLDLLKIQIPSMIIQPFVENAIKHGLYHKLGSKILKIFIYQKTEKTLFIEVIDNGIGRKNAEKINSKRQNHKSFSTQAIYSRIELFNELSDAQIHLKIIDLYDNEQPSGTKVLITIEEKYT